MKFNPEDIMIFSNKHYSIKGKCIWVEIIHIVTGFSMKGEGMDFEILKFRLTEQLKRKIEGRNAKIKIPEEV